MLEGAGGRKKHLFPLPTFIYRQVPWRPLLMSQPISIRGKATDRNKVRGQKELIVSTVFHPFSFHAE